eukprot:6176653-Pleurochrysis_carterae.AAC.2
MVRCERGWPRCRRVSAPVTPAPDASNAQHTGRCDFNAMKRTPNRTHAKSHARQIARTPNRTPACCAGGSASRRAWARAARACGSAARK